MKEARRRLRRFALWLLALALGFCAGAAAAWIAASIVGTRPDGSEQFVAAFWGMVAWGVAGLVATWWFSRPRTYARRWLTIGIPVFALGTVALMKTFGAAAMLGYPLIWFAAFCAALYEPADRD